MDAPSLPPNLASAINTHLEGLKAVNHAGSHVHAQYLVDSWASLVDEVRDYQLSIYDYTNDLDSRNMLEDAAVAIGGELGARLRALLAPLDARFMVNTQPARQSFRAEERMAGLSEADRDAVVAAARRAMGTVDNADVELESSFEVYLSNLRSAGDTAPRPWNSRIPVEPGAELLDDLRSDGYV